MPRRLAQRVRVSHVRDLGLTTDPDLTGKVHQPYEGRLVLMRVGCPLIVVPPDIPFLETSRIREIDRSERLVEVTTGHSVYHVRLLGGADG